MDELKLTIDLAVQDWPLIEQLEYRKTVGTPPLLALKRVQEAFAADDDADIPLAIAELPPEFLLGFAWIASRRADPELSYDNLLKTVNYEQLTDAFIAAMPEPEPDPTKAAPSRRKTTSSTRKR